MVLYYSTPIHFSAPPPSYIPPPRFTNASYTPSATTQSRTSTYHPNHQPPVGPPLLNHRSTAGPPNHQVVTQTVTPKAIYSTPRPRPPAQTYTYTYTPAQRPSQRRSLLTDTSNHPTRNRTQNHAPYSHHAHVLYSTKTAGPVYNTKYIPSLTSPNLGAPEPQPLPLPLRVPREIGWEPRRNLRIAFDLKLRVPRKEGVPLGLFLRMGHRALRELVEAAYEPVLPYIYPETAGVTLRFWSPVHPHPVEEYIVPTDAEGHYTKRLTLALHVARAYYAAAFSAPKSSSQDQNQTKAAKLCKIKAVGPATVSLDDLWLVSLRGTGREDVFDVCVHHHGPRSSSSSTVW